MAASSYSFILKKIEALWVQPENLFVISQFANIISYYTKQQVTSLQVRKTCASQLILIAIKPIILAQQPEYVQYLFLFPQVDPNKFSTIVFHALQSPPIRKSEEFDREAQIFYANLKYTKNPGQPGGHYKLVKFSVMLQYQMSQNNCQRKDCSEKGVGLYATKALKKGDIVYTCQVEKYDCPNDSHASQVDMDKWVTFSLIGRSINHSCNPNCGIGFDGANWVYKAFKDINAGEQLTYDYAMANYKVENFPNCLCQSPNCRREIQGYRNLPKEKKQEYKGFFAPYLQKLAMEDTA